MRGSATDALPTHRLDEPLGGPPREAAVQRDRLVDDTRQAVIADYPLTRLAAELLLECGIVQDAAKAGGKLLRILRLDQQAVHAVGHDILGSADTRGDARQP